MDKKMQAKVERLLARRQGKERMAKVALAVSCVVVFCIVCALVTPAQTAEQPKDITCSLNSLEIHRHTSDCFNSDDELICGYADYVLHTHVEQCYDKQGNLICPLDEIHVHTDECWELGVPQEPDQPTEEGPEPAPEPEINYHTHTEACYGERPLICGQEESTGHVHGDECWEETTNTSTEPICGQVEHTHGEECYTSTTEQILICGQEESEEHTHDAGCWQETINTSSEPTCGQVEHTHEEGCYPTTTDRTLICEQEESEGHTHGDECYGEPELICGMEEGAPESSGDDSSVAQGEEISYRVASVSDNTELEMVLTCEYKDLQTEPHTHKTADEVEGDEESCYDENGNLICGLLELHEHIHTEECFAYEDEEEENPDEADLQDGEQPEDSDGTDLEDGEQPEDSDGTDLEDGEQPEDSDGTDLEDGEQPEDSDETDLEDGELAENPDEIDLGDYELPEDLSDIELPEGMTLEEFLAQLGVATLELGDGTDNQTEDITGYLKGAELWIDDKKTKYEVPMLLPEGQFLVKLNWGWTGQDLAIDPGKVYTYQVPTELTIGAQSNMPLTDAAGNVKGTYDFDPDTHTLSVKFTEKADVVNFNIEMWAEWQGERNDDVKINWSNGVTTDVKFTNNELSIFKQQGDIENTLDGDHILWYKVKVAAGNGGAENIQLTDKLTSEHFELYEGAVENAYDYKYYIVGEDGQILEGTTVQYGHFGEGENGSVTFPEINGLKLDSKQTCVVEYAVKLPSDKRVELDSELKKATLTNEVTAKYGTGDKTDTKTALDEYAYRAESKWVEKKADEGAELNAKSIPWTVTFNRSQSYVMDGATLGDQIKTEGVKYDTTKPITLHKILTAEKIDEPQTVEWCEVPGWCAASIYGYGNAYDILLDPSKAPDEGTRQAAVNAKAAIDMALQNKGVSGGLTAENISNYVFVSKEWSGEYPPTFVWFSPKVDKTSPDAKPYEYDLKYTTDASGSTAAGVQNQAKAGWKAIYTGDIIGKPLVEGIELKKEAEVRTGENLVDWTITLHITEDTTRDLSKIQLYDAWAPIYLDGDETDVYEWLVKNDGSSVTNELDFHKYLSAEEMNLMVKDVFTVTKTDKNNQPVKDFTEGTETNQWKAYLGSQKGVGQGPYGGHFQTYDPTTNYGQYIIKDGTGEFAGKSVTVHGYQINLGTLAPGDTIVVKYTTRVPDALVNQANGTIASLNRAVVCQNDVELKYVDAPYNYTILKANDAVDKSVDYDSANRVLSYEVKINENRQTSAAPWAYQGTPYPFKLTDSLTMPGAKYVEDSIELVFFGSVEGITFKTDNPHEIVLWSSKWKTHEEAYYSSTNPEEGWIAYLFWEALSVEDPSTGSGFELVQNDSTTSSFTLTIDKTIDREDTQGVVQLTQYLRLDKGDVLLPMTLRYKVTPPESPVNGETKVKNTAKLIAVLDTGENVLGTDTTETSFASGLYKKETGRPNESNGYTGTFQLDIDTTTDDWGSASKSNFTIVDTMSENLKLDFDSIVVQGWKDNPQTMVELVKDTNWSYTYQSSNNQLQLTIKNGGYDHYRVTYKAKVFTTSTDGNIKVDYENSATVSNSDMSVEKVENFVYMDGSKGDISTESYVVTINKRNGEASGAAQDVKFSLYKWEPKAAANVADPGEPEGNDPSSSATGSWEQIPSWESDGLYSTTNGVLVLKNDDTKNWQHLYPGYYMLVEEEVPADYSKVTTYFYVGDWTASDRGTLPDGLKESDIGINRGIVYDVDVVNNYIPRYELPETGGPGDTMFIFGGLLITVAAMLIWKKGQKRRSTQS